MICSSSCDQCWAKEGVRGEQIHSPFFLVRGATTLVAPAPAEAVSNIALEGAAVSARPVTGAAGPPRSGNKTKYTMPTKTKSRLAGKSRRTSSNPFSMRPRGGFEEKQNKFLFPNRTSHAIGTRVRHEGKDPARSQEKRDHSMKRQPSACLNLDASELNWVGPCGRGASLSRPPGISGDVNGTRVPSKKRSI